MVRLRDDERMNVWIAVLGIVVGGLAGFAGVFIWGYGPILGLIVLAAFVAVLLQRQMRREAALAVVAAGVVPALILGPTFANSDPAVHFDPSTGPAFVVAIVIALVGLGWEALEWRRAT